MARWAMIIDLRKCIGCGTCSRICHQINNVPPDVHWRKLIEQEIKGNPGRQRLYLTISCMHCERPTCLSVCPTGATYRRSDGIVDINLDMCMGCSSCVVACPYQARSIAKSDIFFRKPAEKNNDRIGICTKCDFCLAIITAGKEKGLQPGIDSEATPRCVLHCIGESLIFGDVEDPESEVSILLRENNAVRLHEELGTNPSVYYILP